MVAGGTDTGKTTFARGLISQIPPDTHGPLLWYVLNVGLVAISYGPAGSARLTGAPHLAWRDDDLWVASDGQRHLIDSDRLAIRRGALELQGLVQLAREQPADPGVPVVALRDGTLVEWMIVRGGDEDALVSLFAPFVAALEELRALEVPVASYISRPRSPYVLNTLRGLICEEDEAGCARWCNTPRIEAEAGPLCARLRGLTDRCLFDALPLPDGARSALFRRSVKESWQQIEAARGVHFFYVNVGPEIGRVEVPEWVAHDPSALDLVHATVVDQARRGDGYPSVLTEAHEQAVLRPGDREALDALLAVELLDEGLSVPLASEKALSKRRRAL